MPPLPKSPPDPKQVYDQADRFHLAEHVLNVQLKMDEATRNAVRIPAMVVSAFSAELYLKCLLLLEGQTFGPIHNLHKLFLPLTDATKAKVQAQWDAMLAATTKDREFFEKKYNTTVPKDVAIALSECGDTFQLLRYVYEGKTIKHYTTYLKLPRFRGHPNICVPGVHNGKKEPTLHAGVPAADDRAGSIRAQSGEPCEGV